MSGSDSIIPDPDARISTGNPGLDSMLEGGVIARRPYLLVGPAGSGKTTLALQFLCEGVRRGERCLLVTLEEPPNECRFNHRGFGTDLEGVDVFDAIPDVMHYERVPFNDISAVRSAMPFRQVPFVIRRTPELTGVEVTVTALEQMLRSEVVRRGYTRIVIDSLTALQYFCMKGLDEVAGAQTFLRFLSDLQVTTLLTVESSLEDVDSTERILARGEVRLFRWEINGSTVRAIGVEKFRGGAHDVRLHPYRISPTGLDIDIGVTVSRRGAKRPRPGGPSASPARR
jgi:KaiC/GvpD/RAD55 family RecA-like ATPase